MIESRPYKSFRDPAGWRQVQPPPFNEEDERYLIGQVRIDMAVLDAKLRANPNLRWAQEFSVMLNQELDGLMIDMCNEAGRFVNRTYPDPITPRRWWRRMLDFWIPEIRPKR